MMASEGEAEMRKRSSGSATHNLDGDDKDVWPWLGLTAKEAKANGGADARFDGVRLEAWRALFDYMQKKGLAVIRTERRITLVALPSRSLIADGMPR